jgi:hypothetical protein
MYTVIGYPTAFLINVAVSLPYMLGMAELIKRLVDDRGIKFSNWVYQAFFMPAQPIQIDPESLRAPERLAEVEVREKEY